MVFETIYSLYEKEVVNDPKGKEAFKVSVNSK